MSDDKISFHFPEDKETLSFAFALTNTEQKLEKNNEKAESFPIY